MNREVESMVVKSMVAYVNFMGVLTVLSFIFHLFFYCFFKGELSPVGCVLFF